MAKHEKTFVDFDRTYETNIIGLKGIIYFAVGLFLLIVVTFGLMRFLMNTMENEAESSDKASEMPLTMDKRERLPPAPRLQVAPGFGVETDDGWNNLELQAPQSEYRVLHEQWEEVWEKGQKDEKTGTVITLPIEEAKNKFLQENAENAQSNEENETIVLEDKRRITSASSAGRTQTVVVR